jgi:hypothetical protein
VLDAHAAGETERRTNRKGRPLARSTRRAEKGNSLLLPGSSSAPAGHGDKGKGNNHERRGRTSLPSLGPQPPSNSSAAFARSGRFFEADATLLGCPVMSELDASATSTHRPGDRASFERIRERSKRLNSRMLARPNSLGLPPLIRKRHPGIRVKRFVERILEGNPSLPSRSYWAA